jgi:type IV secretion system protein VirD4
VALTRNNATGAQLKGKRSKSGILAAIFGLTLLLASAAATQSFAARFDYQKALGPNLFHIYPPFAIFSWFAKWGGNDTADFEFATVCGVAALFAGMIVAAMYKRAGVLSLRSVLHGSARWADRTDIERAGLLPAKNKKVDGVYVGGWLDRNRLKYLRHSGPEHVICFAPTRSGKGVGLVLPTLLSWSESVVITDLKGELFELSAGWRKHYAKNKVVRFEPASLEGSAAWNPLHEIRIGTEYEVGDVQNLVKCIIDVNGKGTEEDHWAGTAETLLVGVILHLLYKNKETATLAKLDAMLADPDRSAKDLWTEMITYSHTDGRNHATVGAAGRDMLDRPDREAGSVLSTAKRYLSLYRDPVVANNTSKSDFTISQLMNHDDPVALYIITQPTDKSRLRPLIRLLLTMILRVLADKQGFERGRVVANYKHKLLLMLDEFPSFGRLEIMQESLAFIAGYGIKAYLILQDLTQLQAAYGKGETITSNCHVQIAFPPNKLETAEHLSRLTGITTIAKEQITRSGNPIQFFSTRSRTQMEVQRPLLTADEAMRMPGPKKDGAGNIVEPGDMVVYAAGFPAIYGQQPLYFRDPIFQARAEIPCPDKTDTL